MSVLMNRGADAAASNQCMFTIAYALLEVLLNDLPSEVDLWDVF